MPTGLTHALAAGALVAVAPTQAPKARLAISMGLLAVLPDLDVLGLRAGIPYGDMLGHRGFSHSLLFAVLASSAVACTAFHSLAVPPEAGKRKMFSRIWWQVQLLLFLATASHGFLDAFTDAGLGVGFFIPLDNSRYFFPWRPLATSPLSVSAFLNGPALRILGNELLWVGTPVAAALGVLYAVRAFLSSPGGGPTGRVPGGRQTGRSPGGGKRKMQGTDDQRTKELSASRHSSATRRR